MENSINVSKAFELRDALANNVGVAVIAGGFARDTFFGVCPKDCDIVVGITKFLNKDTALQYALDTVRDVLGHNSTAVRNMAVHLTYNDTTSDRVYYIIKLPTLGIDIILYRDCEGTQDIIDAFDFNINQFIICDVAEDLPNEAVYLGNTDLRTLTRVREDTSDKRDIKVFRKHQDLLTKIHHAYSSGKLQ